VGLVRQPHRGRVVARGNLKDVAFAVISWGDGSTSAGLITDSGGGTLTVSGSHTYAAPGRYPVTVQIRHILGLTTPMTTFGTAVVSNLGLPVARGQAANCAFWAGRGQALILSFNGGPGATALSDWLVATLPRLFGAGAGAFDLTGRTNAQVAALYRRLRGPRRRLEADVLAAALSVYATTLSLGGTAGPGFRFAGSATGLGARLHPVRRSGAAFGVANGSRLNVYQLLVAADRRAVRGVAYGGRRGSRQQAEQVFTALLAAGKT
jgi:hypothetical protein